MRSFLIFLAGMAAGWYLTNHQAQVKSVAHKAKAEMHSMTADHIEVAP